MFLHCCLWSIFSYFYVKNSKTHKKEKIQKVWSTLLSFVSKYVLPCTFMQMALCIYEHSLFPMHSYHCGRNFEIYVTVVNRSSFWVFPSICLWLFIVFLVWTSFNITMFTHKSLYSPYSLSPFTNLQVKVWVLFLSQYVSHIL